MAAGRFASAGIIGFVLLGCSTFKPADTLRPRAANDLRCPADQLVFTPLGGDCEGTKIANHYDCTYGVRCGDNQVTYVHVNGSNTWVADMASSTAKAAPPVAPATPAPVQ